MSDIRYILSVLVDDKLVYHQNTPDSSDIIALLGVAELEVEKELNEQGEK